jgi:hypothetical protein
MYNGSLERIKSTRGEALKLYTRIIFESDSKAAELEK